MVAVPPVISVVIPLYNAGRWILATLQSVRAQTFADWEVVVVDDGSQDDGPSLVEAEAARDSRIRLMRQANAGPAVARHFGAQHARGDWLMFLDADDLLPPGRMMGDLAAARAHPASQIIAGQVEWFSGEGRVMHRGILDADAERNLWRHQFHAVFNFAALMARRPAYFASGGFSPDRSVHYAEDYDYTLRLLEQGEVSLVEGVSLRVRKHENNRSTLAERTVVEHTLEVIRRAWQRNGADLSAAEAERLFRFWRLDPGPLGVSDLQDLVRLQGRLFSAYFAKRPAARTSVIQAWEQMLALRIAESRLAAGEAKALLRLEAEERGSLSAWRVRLRVLKQRWRR